jgi:MYXO-CTERM domain-containing protein
LAYNIALSSFTGAINWNSIDFITFSGGGVAELDLSMSAPFSMETTMMAPVPEPGTWAAAALLAGLAGFIHWRRRRANA